MGRTVKLTWKLVRERADRVRKVNERTVLAGMTRPARPADKRAALQRISGLGPFAEGKTAPPSKRPAGPG